MTVNQVGENPWVPGVQHDTFVPDQLLSGPLQVVSDTVTVVQGATAKYQRGTVLGMITVSEKYTLSVKTATDGSQIPTAILADYADASIADTTAGVYLMAEINQNRIIFDPSWTLAALKVALRPSGIFLRDSIQAPAS